MINEKLFTTPLKRGTLSIEWAKNISRRLSFLIKTRLESEDYINCYLHIFTIEKEENRCEQAQKILERYDSTLRDIEKENIGTPSNIFHNYLFLMDGFKNIFEASEKDLLYYFKIQPLARVWEDFIMENCKEYSETIAKQETYSFLVESSEELKEELQSILGGNYLTLPAMGMLKLFSHDKEAYEYFLSIYSTETGTYLYKEIKEWFLIHLTKDGRLYSYSTTKQSFINFCLRFFREKASWKRSKEQCADFVCKLMEEMRLILLSSSREDITIWNDDYECLQAISKLEEE